MTILTACAVLFALAFTPLVQPGLADGRRGLPFDSAQVAGSAGVVPLAGGGYLSVVPVTSSVDLGGTVDVEIWVNDVERLYSLDFCLSFSEAYVSVPSNNATILYDVFDPAFLHSYVIYNRVGTADTSVCQCTPESGKRYYHFAVTNANPALPFTGSGRVARLTFRGDAAGTTPLHFCFVQSSDSTGHALIPPTVGVDGSITVKGPPTLSIEPAATGVFLHNTTSVDIWLRDVKNVYTLEFCVGFDGALVSVPAGAATLRWEVFDEWDNMVFANFAGDPAAVGCACAGYSKAYHYIVTQLNPALPFSGSGRVATLTFGGVTPGTTPLHFCSALGSTVDGGAIPLVLEDGSMIVTGDPTAVVLHGVEAQSRTGQVVVKWSTVSENDLVGFNLYRAESPDGDTKQLNATLIPLQAPGSSIGADYRYLDLTVEVGRTYDYYIEVLDLTGTPTRTDPLRVPVDYYAVVPIMRR